MDGSAECGPRMQELARERIAELLGPVGDEADSQYELDAVVSSWGLLGGRRLNGVSEHLVQSMLPFAPICAWDARLVDEMVRPCVESQFSRALDGLEEVARRDQQMPGLAQCGPSASPAVCAAARASLCVRSP